MMTRQSPGGSPSAVKRVSFAPEQQSVGYTVGGKNYESYQQHQQQPSPQRFGGGNYRGYPRPNFGQTRFQLLNRGQTRGNVGPKFAPRNFAPRTTPWGAQFGSPARGVAPGFGGSSCPKCGRGAHQKFRTCCSALLTENFAIYANSPGTSRRFVAQL